MRLLLIFALCLWWLATETVQAEGEISLSPAIAKVVIENLDITFDRLREYFKKHEL